MQQGVDLMLFGMGTVFVFLSLLVVSTLLLSTFINKFFPEEEKALPLVATTSAKKAGTVKPDILQAISLAIEQHRTK